MMQLKDEQTI